MYAKTPITLLSTGMPGILAVTTDLQGGSAGHFHSEALRIFSSKSKNPKILMIRNAAFFRVVLAEKKVFFSFGNFAETSKFRVGTTNFQHEMKCQTWISVCMRLGSLLEN